MNKAELNARKKRLLLEGEVLRLQLLKDKLQFQHNLRASHALNSAWHLNARLENLLDRHYELIHGYNTPGRSAYLELNWEPR